MSASGVVLFQKAWVDSSTKDRDRMFGQLLTSMQEFARQATGLRVAYLEFNALALSLADAPAGGLIGALFHDLEDGEAFGRVIANQILKAFLEEFNDVKFSGPGLNIGRFNSFSGKLYEAISSATRAVLQDLQAVKGISNALVVHSDGRAVTALAEEDQLAIVANLQPLTPVAQALMAAKKDKAKFITLSMSRQIVYVFFLRDAALVAVCRKSVKQNVYMEDMKSSCKLITQVLGVANALIS